MTLPSRPDFLLGDCAISWKGASLGVLVTENENGGPVDDAFFYFKRYLEFYVQQNGISLLISDCRKLYFHGPDRARQSLRTYVGKYVLGHQEVAGEFWYGIEAELMNSLIILIGPAFCMKDEFKGYGTEYVILDDILTREIDVGRFSVVLPKDVEENALQVLCSLWRRARVLSIAAFAVVSGWPFPFDEIGYASTKISLFHDEQAMPQDLILNDGQGASARVVRIFNDMVAAGRGVYLEK